MLDKRKDEETLPDRALNIDVKSLHDENVRLCYSFLHFSSVSPTGPQL